MVAKAVKVTRKRQITLPVELRKEFDVNEGGINYVRRGERGTEITTLEDIVARTASIFREYADKLGPLEPDEIRSLPRNTGPRTLLPTLSSTTTTQREAGLHR